jgi:hypothetical protein
MTYCPTSSSDGDLVRYQLLPGHQWFHEQYSWLLSRKIRIWIDRNVRNLIRMTSPSLCTQFLPVSPRLPLAMASNVPDDISIEEIAKEVLVVRVSCQYLRAEVRTKALLSIPQVRFLESRNGFSYNVMAHCYFSINIGIIGAFRSSISSTVDRQTSWVRSMTMRSRLEPRYCTSVGTPLNLTDENAVSLHVEQTDLTDKGDVLPQPIRSICGRVWNSLG